MSDWRAEVDRLLYEGESVEETLAVGSAGVAVTSHRLLAFTPERDGANFRQVDRPNVDGVSTGTGARDGLLERALRYGLVGAVLFVAGQFLDFGGLVDGVDLSGQASQEMGLGGIMGTLQGMLNLLAQLDQLLQVGGALALLLAVVLFGGYWATREETLVVEVAGDEDVHLPRPMDAAAVTTRLETALGTGAGDLGGEFGSTAATVDAGSPERGPTDSQSGPTDEGDPLGES